MNSAMANQSSLHHYIDIGGGGWSFCLTIFLLFHKGDGKLYVSHLSIGCIIPPCLVAICLFHPFFPTKIFHPPQKKNRPPSSRAYSISLMAAPLTNKLCDCEAWLKPKGRSRPQCPLLINQTINQSINQSIDQSTTRSYLINFSGVGFPSARLGKLDKINYRIKPLYLSSRSRGGAPLQRFFFCFACQYMKIPTDLDPNPPPPLRRILSQNPPPPPLKNS